MLIILTVIPVVKTVENKAFYNCGTVKAEGVEMPKCFVIIACVREGNSGVGDINSSVDAALGKDRKNILFLSKFHAATDVSCVTIKSTVGTCHDVSCPQITEQQKYAWDVLTKMGRLQETARVECNTCGYSGISFTLRSSVSIFYKSKAEMQRQ